jgi:competence protein ComEC
LGTLCLFLGFTYAHTWRRFHWRSVELGKTTVQGTVIAPPDNRPKSLYLTVQTQEPLGANILQEPAPVTLLVKADRYLSTRYGDEVSVTGKLEVPEAFSGFNYPGFLERDHIFGIVPQAQVKITKPRTRHSLTQWLFDARTALETNINRYIPEPESSFLAGILLGSRRAIPSDVTSALQATGTSHMVAISGANITIVVSGALALLPIAHPILRCIAVITLGGGLALLSGGSASVVRGAFVVGIGTFIRALGRRPWPAAVILLAAALMLLTNPLLIRVDPSFQLSFGAYAGLLLLGTAVQKLIERTKLPPLLGGSLAETISASSGTAPLTIFNGTFAARGFLINPLVLWLIPPATALGFLLIFTSPFPAIAHIIAIPTWATLHAALWIITTGARPGSSP